MVQSTAALHDTLHWLAAAPTCSSSLRVMTWQPRLYGGSSTTLCTLREGGRGRQQPGWSAFWLLRSAC